MPISGAPTKAIDEPSPDLPVGRYALQIATTLKFGGAEYFAVPEGALSVNGMIAPQAEGLGEALIGRLDLEGRRYLLFGADALRDKGPSASNELSISELLTRRELQVALMIAEGKCDKVIAHSLGISGYTVREHVRRITHKLRVSNRCAIVAYILTNGDRNFD